MASTTSFCVLSDATETVNLPASKFWICIPSISFIALFTLVWQCVLCILGTLIITCFILLEFELLFDTANFGTIPFCIVVQFLI